MLTNDSSNAAIREALAALALFDPAPIAELRALDADGSKGLVPRIVRRFIDGLPAQLAAMRARDGADSGLARRAAHSLKSAAAQLGALRLASLAARIEECLRSGHDEAAWALGDALEIAAAQTVPRLAVLAQ